MVEDLSISSTNQVMEWFTSGDQIDSINKSKLEALILRYDLSVLTDKLVSNFKYDKKVLFLFCELFGSHRINVFHHVKGFNGSILEENKKLTFVQGTNKMALSIMIPNVKNPIG